MKEVRNIDSKRIFDMSDDNRVIYIRIKGCETTITANPDGTLNVTHKKSKKFFLRTKKRQISHNSCIKIR